MNDIYDEKFWSEREAMLEQIRREEEIAKLRRQQEEQNRRIRGVPAIYREKFDRALSKMAKETIDYVARWQPTERKGIGLSGVSGAGKTRLLCAKLLSFPAAVSWLYLPSSDLAAATRNQWDDDLGISGPAYQKLKDARRVRVLMLDDIGDEAPSESVSEGMKDLIEHRVARGMPIFWTTNLSSAQLSAHHRTRGEAIVRRLVEFSWMP